MPIQMPDIWSFCKVSDVCLSTPSTRNILTSYFKFETKKLCIFLKVNSLEDFWACGHRMAIWYPKYRVSVIKQRSGSSFSRELLLLSLGKFEMFYLRRFLIFSGYYSLIATIHCLTGIIKSVIAFESLFFQWNCCFGKLAITISLDLRVQLFDAVSHLRRNCPFFDMKFSSMKDCDRYLCNFDFSNKPLVGSLCSILKCQLHL